MIVLDTHVWIWWLSDPRRLSANAADAIDESEKIGVSAISGWELAMKARAGKLGLDRPVGEWVAQALANERVTSLDVTWQIAERAGSLDGEFHGDPADRIIVATAMARRCPIVTKDRRIRQHRSVQTIW